MREWKGQADWIKDDSSDHTSNHEFRLGPGRARQDKSGAGKEWFFPFSLVPRLSFRLGERERDSGWGGIGFPNCKRDFHLFIVVYSHCYFRLATVFYPSVQISL